jgi:hypothetical protein
MATRMPSSDHVPWRVLMVTPSGYVEVVEVCAPDEATALDTARHWKPCHEVATDPSGKPLIWGRPRVSRLARWVLRAQDERAEHPQSYCRCVAHRGPSQGDVDETQTL